MADYIKDPHHKTSVITRFNKIAAGYDVFAYLPKLMGQELINRLTDIENQPSPTRILDLGGGTGHFSFILQEKFPQAEIYNLDAAFEMLQQTNNKQLDASKNPIHKVLADAEHLPFPTNSFDFIFCNCLFYCLSSLKPILNQVMRVLKPNGLFLFSSLGPDTLKELKTCYQDLDNHTHINHFPDMHDLGDLLLSLGFKMPVMDRDEIMLGFTTVFEIFKDIKQAGENSVFGRRDTGLKTRIWLEQVTQNYEKFRNHTGQLPVTIEIIYGYALGAEKTNMDPACSSKMIRVVLSKD